MNGVIKGLSLWPAGACLVSELARELLSLPPDALQATRVVLPTKRLRNWLLAIMATERPAFVAPRFYNLDDFLKTLLRETAPSSAEPEPRAAAPLTLELLLADLLAQGDYRHLGPGHAHEIQQLLAEAAEWGLRPTLFTALEEAVARDVVRSEAGLSSLSERFRELDDVAKKLDAALAAVGEETPEGQTRRRCETVAQRLALARKLPGDITYVVGFSSLGGHHQTLLAALASLPNAAVWMNEAPPLASGKNPLALLRALFPGDIVTVRQAHAPTALSGGARMAVFRADTVRDEVELALQLVDDALNRGVSAAHIAVLVTSEPDYGVPLLRALARRQTPYNAAIALPLAATDLGQWLMALAALIDSPQSPEAALDLLAHPLSCALWQAAPRLGRAQIAAMLGDLDAPRPFAQLAPRDAELQDYVQRVCRALEPFLGNAAHGPARPYPARRWVALLEQVMAPLVAEVPGADMLAAAAKIAVQQFIDDFTRAARSVPGTSSAQNFFRFFAPRALAQDVREVGDQLRGVQILGVAEARYVPFQFVIILGALEGCFPRALPKDHLVDHWLKTKVGLPGWQLLEAIEDTTFHLLASRLPALALTYPERLGAEPAVRSRFVEELVARRGVRVGTVPRPKHMPAPKRPALTARLENQGALPSGASITELPWSASALEIFIRCPYRHLLDRLGVEDVELPREGDPRREGDRLHAVLEAFFTGRADKRTVAPPLTQPDSWEDFEAYCTQRLWTLSERLLPRAYLESAEGLQLRFKAWPAFAAHLKTIYNEETWQRARRGLRELGFRTEHFKGKIDSVDHLTDFHVITDYKRSGAPSPVDARQGIAPQLAVYAAALAEGAAEDLLPLERAVLGYWRILDGSWVGVSAGSAAMSAAKAAKLVPPKAAVETESLIAAVDELVDWRRDATRQAGAYVPDPSQCGFCRWHGICRRDDPQAKSLFQARDLLDQRLNKWSADTGQSEDPTDE